LLAQLARALGCLLNGIDEVLLDRCGLQGVHGALGRAARADPAAAGDSLLWRARLAAPKKVSTVSARLAPEPDRSSSAAHSAS
jgi:hypothetical protein